MDKIIDTIEEIIINNSFDDIKSIIHLINFEYDEGYLLDVLFMRDDLDLLNILKLLISKNVNIHINNECLLRAFAHEGKIELLNYMLYNCNCNHKILYKTTAGSNYDTTKNALLIYEDYLSKNSKSKLKL